MNEVTKQFAKLSAILFGTTFVTLIALWVYPHVDPDNEYQLLRSMIARLANVNVGGCYLLMWLCLFDFVTTGDYLAKIEENSIACAILGGCICISLALMFIYY